MPYRGRGVIKRHKAWKRTPKRETALQRLAELKVDIYSSLTEVNYTLLIPHTLSGPEYIEIGYLLAQLDDAQFPEHYACLSDTATKVFKRQKGAAVNVYFVDSHPHGLKYRVVPIADDPPDPEPPNTGCN
jgi:hypothetical protein